MHNYFDRPIDITAEKRNMWAIYLWLQRRMVQLLSQAILWLGNTKKSSRRLYRLSIPHGLRKNGGTILAEGNDWVMIFNRTPAEFVPGSLRLQ